MFSTNKKWSIFIVFMVMSSGSESFRLQTEKSLTAVRGGSISLPCNFSVHAHAVYWYKHNFTGAPDDGASLVGARYSFGFTDPLQGFERFSITTDYSLFIRNITVHDETTYSCLVVEIDRERGYTDLRVIALAEPLEPIIESCNVTRPGRCFYVIDEISPEDVKLVCMVYNVRPPPRVKWVRSDGRVPENATQQMQEKDGLSNISSQIQVTKSDFDKQYTCEANGDAVNGTSSMKITVIEGDDTTDSHDRGINKSLITSIVINFILLILFVSCLIYYKKCGSPGPLGVVKLQKPEQLGDIESQPLTDQEELTATKLSQKIKLLENERKEDRASFEEEKRVIESNWQETVNDQFEKLKTQELTVTKLSKKIESLENKRKEDRASFKEEKRVIESNSQKTVNDQFEKLKTQELAITELSQKVKALENERKKDRASFEEEKLEIESNWQKIVNEQVMKLETQELAMTELSQKIESSENVKEDRSSFEEENREIESKLQEIVNDQVEKLKTQELTAIKPSQKIEALENQRKEDRASSEEENREIESNCQKTVNDQVDKLETQGNPKSAENRNDFDEILITAAQRLRKVSEIDTLGTNLGFTPEEVQIYIATNHKTDITKCNGTIKMLRDWRKRQGVSAVRDTLKKALEKSGQTCIADEIFTSQNTLTKFSQETEALEYKREIYQAILDKEKLAIESKLKKQLESLNKNVDELENGNRSRDNPKPTEDDHDLDETLMTVAKKLREYSEVETLGSYLGFTRFQVMTIICNTFVNHMKCVLWIPILRMLRDWQNRQEDSTVRDALKNALENSGQTAIADEIFPSKHTVTKLRQKIEALENDRERYQAKFEKEKRAIELKWNKQAQSLNENVDELENGNRSRGDETDDNRA